MHSNRFNLPGKKTWTKQILFLIVCLFASSTNLFSSSSYGQSEITFGVTPYLSENSIKQSFNPILDALSDQLGRKVTLVIARDYSDLTEKMQVGHVDFGAFSPFAYVDAVNKASVKVFASHTVNEKPNYHGLIITRNQSGIRTIDELYDRVFAFVDPKSASGFLYPRSLLINEGKNPDLFFSKTYFSGSHDKVLDDVYHQKADAGAVYSDALKMANDKYETGSFKVLLQTEPIPYDAYVAGKHVDPKLLATVKAFFLSLSKNTEPLKSVLKQKSGIQFSGWIAANDSRYNIVRETAALLQEKKRIAVFKFKTKDKSMSKKNLPDVFSEITSAYLAETRQFEVIPQFQLEKMLLEHNSNLDAPLTNTLLNLLQNELNLDYVVSGTLNLNNKKQVSVHCTLQSTDETKPKEAYRTSGDAIESLNTMAESCVTWIQKKLPIEAYIMAVHGNEIIVHGGRNMGFQSGGSFNIVNLGEKLYGQNKNDIVGRKRRKVAGGRFKSIEKDTSVGEITGGNVSQVDVGSRVRIADLTTDFSKAVYDGYLKGLHALAKGDNKAAATYFKKVTHLDPNYAMAHARLSTAWYNLGKRKNGSKHLSIAKNLSNSITFQERNYILARYASENGDSQKAISLYAAILEKYPNNTSAMHNLGMLYLYSNPERAKAWFERALVIDPDLVISKQALGSIRYQSPSKQGASNRQVDVVVLFDTTISMTGGIRGMKENTRAFVTELKKSGIDVRLGLITFGDRIRDMHFKQGTNLTLTSDIGLFEKKLAKLDADGGKDRPENAYLAIEKALSFKFRKNSRAVLLLITDAPPHQNDAVYPNTTGHIIKTLKKRHISVAIIGPELTDYNRIAKNTNGTLVNIKSNPDFIQKLSLISDTIINLF